MIDRLLFAVCADTYRRNNGQAKGEGEWEGEGEREDVGLHYEEKVAGLRDAEGEWEGQWTSKRGSSLKPEMVEALVCGASYIKGSHKDFNVVV